LAAAAAVLREHYPQVSTFEIVRTLWSVAQNETPAPQALRLLHRTRAALHFHPLPEPGREFLTTAKISGLERG
jgi:hypothetical protein